MNEPVVDRAARDKLTNELSLLISGEMTNDQFDEAEPEDCKDPVATVLRTTAARTAGSLRRSSFRSSACAWGIVRGFAHHVPARTIVG